MSKYVIEIEEKPLCVFDKDTQTFFPRLWRVKGFNSLVLDEEGLSRLEELNSDYINENFGELQDEAYQRGYDDGYKKCLSVYDFDQPCISCEGYKRGLNDAWEAARKIALMDTETSENVTGYFGLFRIMENLTPMQAIEKLKAYEEKQKDRIEVGDEVVTKTGKKYTAVSFGYGGTVCGFNTDGKWTGWKPKEVTKTGKQYDIQSILEAMRK